jgi:hypothetical protein
MGLESEGGSVKRAWPGTSMPVRVEGQGGQGLRSGHAGGPGSVAGFFLGDGGQYGTLGVT